MRFFITLLILLFATLAYVQVISVSLFSHSNWMTPLSLLVGIRRSFDRG